MSLVRTRLYVSYLLYCVVSHRILYCIALYCTVMKSNVMKSTVLHRIVLYCIVLYCMHSSVFTYLILYCTILYCLVLSCHVMLYMFYNVMLCCVDLRCVAFVLHCAALCYFALGFKVVLYYVAKNYSIEALNRLLTLKESSRFSPPQMSI